MPTTNGAMIRSPAASAHSIRSRHQNGRSRACGCHASNSSSLPMLQARPADSAVASTIARSPPARWAAQAAPTMARMLAVITATARPTLGPATRTNGASTSNHSGPGLLMVCPAACDAEVQVPSSGWFAVATSCARRRMSPLSPIAIQPRWSVRTVATTTGSAATATDAIGTIHERRGLTPPPRPCCRRFWSADRPLGVHSADQNRLTRVEAGGASPRRRAGARPRRTARGRGASRTGPASPRSGTAGRCARRTRRPPRSKARIPTVTTPARRGRRRTPSTMVDPTAAASIQAGPTRRPAAATQTTAPATSAGRGAGAPGKPRRGRA